MLRFAVMCGLLMTGAAIGAGEDVDVDVLVLAKARFFNTDYVGEAAAIPNEVIAYQRIVRRKDGAEIFEKLLKCDNTNAQLYGLVGLSVTDPRKFSAESDRCKHRADQVTGWAGCKKRESTFSDLLAEIASGELPKRIDRLGRAKAEALSASLAGATRDELKRKIDSSQVVAALGNRLDGEKNVDFLCGLLKSGSPREVTIALTALKELGPWGRRAADQLFKVYGRNKLLVARVLANLYPCEDGLPAMKKIFGDKAADKEAMAILIDSLSVYGEKAIPLLRLAENHRDGEVKDAAKEGLKSLERSSK